MSLLAIVKVFLNLKENFWVELDHQKGMGGEGWGGRFMGGEGRGGRFMGGEGREVYGRGGGS